MQGLVQALTGTHASGMMYVELEKLRDAVAAAATALGAIDLSDVGKLASMVLSLLLWVDLHWIGDSLAYRSPTFRLCGGHTGARQTLG